MNIYCITFPQYHPLRDCWIQLMARDESTARKAAFVLFDRRFGSVYPSEDFDTSDYTGGAVGRTMSAMEILSGRDI